MLAVSNSTPLCPFLQDSAFQPGNFGSPPQQIGRLVQRYLCRRRICNTGACVGVCVHGCVHGCVRGCVRAWVCACVRGCVRACVGGCMRGWVHACVGACVGGCMRGCVRACMYACAGQASEPKEAKSKGDWAPSKNPHHPKQTVL